MSAMDLQHLHLEVHPTARSKAVASHAISAGLTLLSTPCLASILLPSEKGRRCDNCYIRQSDELTLRKCSGCASYWYCDTKCQKSQWDTHHKKICRLYNRHVTSVQYQALPPHEQTDSILLTHLIATAAVASVPPLDRASPLSSVMELMPGPTTDSTAPPICSINTSPPLSKGAMNALYARFGNNNFAIHSHLVTYAHGVFPAASRLFNHSCIPNAAAKYIIKQFEPIRMEVVALRDINEGEEVCLPYLDPALLQTRQQIFDITYGFRCTCASCGFLATIGQIPEPPTDPRARAEIDKSLRGFLSPAGVIRPEFFALPPASIYQNVSGLSIPACVFHESYLTSLSEDFSKASHEGPYDIALETGRTMLALYNLIYPPYYPQIGMHLLEMAKTAWNAIVTSSSPLGAEEHKRRVEEVRRYLIRAQDILDVFGTEGDKGGPLEEIQTLKGLIEQE